MLGNSGVFGTMKRLLIVASIFVFSMSVIFGTLGDPYRRTQQISGFVDDISFLYISPYHYDSVAENGFVGINLDYNDQSNEIRGIIAPTNESFTLPGIVIGTFSVLCTFIEAAQQTNPVLPVVKLTIEHDKLRHTTDSSAQLEYELAVSYSINGGTSHTEYCLSVSSSAEGPKKIEVSLTDGATNHMVSIQNANIYFRFAEGESPSVIGQYESGIVFTLEGT